MLDVRTLIGDSRRYNLHGHTQFCDGHAPMEDFVVEAIARHFTHYGFTPHAPTHIESPCNMPFDRMEVFLAEVSRLQTKYQGQIKILCGLEIDYIDGFGPADDYFHSLPLDYSIGSVHFIPSLHDADTWVDVDGRFERFKVKMGQYFDNDIEWVVRTYYNQMLSMVEQGGFDIVGHLDKIGFNAEQFSPGINQAAWYVNLVTHLIESIMDHGYVVEINTKAWLQHGRLYPEPRYFTLLRRYDAPVVINSDAHYPQLIDAGRAEALNLYLKA